MNNRQIEAVVYDLHSDMWKHRLALSGLQMPSPLSLCEPRIFAKVLGLEYEEFETLGRFGSGSDRFETAGILDREHSLIAVSQRFSFEIRRFTGAHEVGHYLLHEDAIHHRDRPISEMDSTRPPIEQQADYFAACSLVPPNILRQEFKLRFGSREPLPLNDTVAFYLTRGHGQDLLGFPTGTLRFAKAVAGARSFGNQPFVSLAAHFKVSVSAMAIRLKELGVVVD